MRHAFMTLSTLTLVLAGCSDPTSNTGSSPINPDPQASTLRVHVSGATVQWNAIERGLLIKHTFADQNAALRQFAYLSLAQYQAVIAADQAEDGPSHPSRQTAVAGASAAVLTYFYPDEQASLDGQVGLQADGTPWPARSPADLAAGEAAGRAAAVQVIARAATDRFTDPWTGTIPVCPGCWHPNTPGLAPVHPQQGQMRPFFLRSGDQFRPAPPPAFGSPEFLAALAEIRQFSDTRTHVQDSIAKYWAFPVGTSLVAGFWNGFAASLIVAHHQGDRRAARTLALMNMAALDALTASHDAKFYYWLIRPTQADPLITLSIGLPNHPSYTSNHAAVSTTIALILGRVFPPEASRLAAMAEEAGVSRLYGGIHYRFDKTAGEEIAHHVAAWAIRHSRCRERDEGRDDRDDHGREDRGHDRGCLHLAGRTDH